MNCQRLLWQMMGCILAVLFLSACGTQATPVPTAVPPTVIPSSTPIPSLTSTPTLGPSELRSTILAAINSLKDKSWRYQSDTVLVDGKTHNTVLEYSPPDRYHIVSDSKSELIVIGQKVYFKQGEAWTESQMLATSIIDPDASKKLEESISDVQFIGTDSLNGKPVRAYQYQSKTKIGDTESTVQTKLWIGVADNLPYKMIVDGETATADASTGKVVGVKATSTILYEYDPTIKIALPVK
jgi:hypothetical protein